MKKNQTWRPTPPLDAMWPTLAAYCEDITGYLDAYWQSSYNYRSTLPIQIQFITDQATSEDFWNSLAMIPTLFSRQTSTDQQSSMVEVRWLLRYMPKQTTACTVGQRMFIVSGWPCMRPSLGSALPEDCIQEGSWEEGFVQESGHLH